MTDDVILHSGAKLTNIHPEEVCSAKWGRHGHCPIHSPSDHPLKDAPMDWYGGEIRHLVRVCEHGLYHPDPDDIAFKMATLDWMTVEAISSVHLVEENCDGCCRLRLIADPRENK